ncbi:hypothetical protein GCM10027442_04420 [Emticicia fontis]
MVKNQELKKSHLFWFGFVAGMVPFTKLQAIPIAALLALITYWLIYQKKKKQSISYFSIFTLGGLCVPCLLVVFGAYFGFLENLWVFYIKNNLSYGSNVSILSGFIHSFSDPINIFTKIIVVLGGMLIGYQFFYKKQFKPTFTSLFILVFISSSIFAVFKPGFMFHHYLLFLVFPTVLLFGYFLNEFLILPDFRLKKIVIATTLLVILAFTVNVQGKNEYVTANHSVRPMNISPISQEILRYTLPNEPLVIWGESGKHYLETKRKQGVRWSHTYWGMYSEPQQKLFRQAYVEQFQRILAPVFIDTHVNAGSFIVRKDCGYETVPELKKIVDENYQFLAEIDQQRIYIRNDRLADIHQRKELTEINSMGVAE